jgi:hypothetical protein
VLESKHSTRRACASATTFETTSDSLEPFPESGAFQSSIQAAEQPESYRNTQSAESDSPRAASGIHTPIHSPKGSDVGAYQALDESTEKLELQPSHPIIGSSSAENGEQSGLAASIHAPERCLPSQDVKHSFKHSADTPNWAAAARAKASAKSGSSSPTCRGKTPAEPSLDEDESEPSTTTGCAYEDEEEGSVDNCDGSLGSTEDQEGIMGPGEAEDGPDADTDPNEEDSTTRPRRARHRGRPRRPRQKVPYLPPPRMRNLTQHPIVDVFAAQAQALNVPAAPSTSPSGQYYSPVLPQTSQHGPSIPSGVIPPSVTTTHGQLGQHFHYNQAPHLHPPHPAGVSPPVPIPSLSPFPSPDTYHPAWYSPSPFPQYVSPQIPFGSSYGR